MYLDILQQLAIALGLSSLIGLDRERNFIQGNIFSFGGIRTFPLIGLSGALAYIIGQDMEFIFPIITFGFLALMVSAYVMSTIKGQGAGGTTIIAGILVYLIGVLCAKEEYIIATIVTLTILLILYFKISLHSFAEKISDQEILSTIRFLIIAFVVLPVLPGEAYGPLGFFNPYIIWLMVVFVSAISFMSYIAIKFLGTSKGIGLIGFLGGFLSSTALAFTLCFKSKKINEGKNIFVSAMLIGLFALMIRILFIIFVLDIGLFQYLYLPVGFMTLMLLIMSFLSWKQKERTPFNLEKEMIDVKNPFRLKPSLEFGLIFAGILFANKAALHFFGQEGIYITSVISGALEGSAMTVSILNIINTDIFYNTAVIALTIGLVSNMLSKAGMFLFLGNKKVALKLFVFLIPVILSGGVGLFLSFLDFF